MDILEVKHLTKIFGAGKKIFTAVDDISFSLKEGEILGLLGRNGAGKTTIIQMLLGILTQTFGNILYFGKDLKKNREEILQKINFSSTYISMPWFFTLEEILDLYAKLYQIKDRKKRITKLAEEFEITHLLQKQFHTLSAGEKTRLLMTKAFLNYPEIILLDEPTASLDVDIAVKIRDFLKRERKEYKVSMLLTSHNMAEVEEMCDRVIIINHGKVVDEDTPDKLAKKISTCFVHLRIEDEELAKAYFTKAKIKFSHEKNVFSISIIEQKVARLLTSIAKAKIMYSEITVDKPDLEDYFLQVVGKEKYELE